ncbi:MAG: cell division protein FtsQ/DivIB [Cyclobacteriaceae bacterium]
MKRILKLALYSVAILGMLVMLGLVQKRHEERLCTDVRIYIENQYNNYFIGENDVLELINNRGHDKLIGVPASQIDLREIENRVLAHKFVHRAEAFKDHTGSLNVRVYQNRPIARMVSSRFPDRYVTEEGKILPVSGRFTARVILISGDFAESASQSDLYESKAGSSLLKLIKFIENDRFWKAQIAQVEMSRSGEITMYPQVGRQIIEFGKAEDLEQKFNRLSLFYKEILPKKGWNHYSKVNVKYRKQIICE